MSEDSLVYLSAYDWRPEVPGSIFWRKVKQIRWLIANSQFSPRSDDVVEWKRTIEEWPNSKLVKAVRFSQKSGPGPIRTLVKAHPAYYQAICEVCEERFQRDSKKGVRND